MQGQNQCYVYLSWDVNKPAIVLEEFDEFQLYFINKAIHSCLDFEPYATPEFDDMQMEQIYLGLASKDIDVSIYAITDFKANQMERRC